MATAEGIKAKLQGLIEAANAKTGKSDTDLTAAVQSLIYGSGGPNPCNLLGYTLGAPGGENYTGFVHSWNTSAADFAILGDLYTKKICLTAKKQIPENITSEIKQENVPGIVGHKYYFQGQIKTSKSSGGYILTAFYDATNNTTHSTRDQLYPSIANEWVTYHRVVECEHEGNYFRILLGIENCDSGDTAELKNLILFDLTELFGSGSEPSDEWCFAEYGNLIVDSSYPKEVGKYSYNGTVLPALPTEILAEYPYVFIGLVQSTGKYQILASTQPMYFYDNDRIVRQNSNSEPFVYCVEGDEKWSSGKSGNYSWAINSDRIIIWSNHDIPNGSATATEIYFEGSQPVLVE